jgi:soluble lytic murein transglycosylase
MIPPTSTQVAASSRDLLQPDQLYDPELNIRLGANLHRPAVREVRARDPAHRRRLQRGPRMMTRWCEQHAKYPTDEFVELIAFPQTREYVKRVTSIYAKYRYLYGSAPYEIPLTLTTTVAKTGPDY